MLDKGSGPPDAIFVANDHMAISVMDTLRHARGLRVPEDISVVGYDDVPQAAWPSYGLTTVEQPSEPMIEATVRVLARQIESGAVVRDDTRLPATLVVRGSARRPEGVRPAEGRRDGREIWIFPETD